MTFQIFDHLRMLSDVLTASVIVLGLGSLFVCFKLLIASMPVKASLTPA